MKKLIHIVIVFLIAFSARAQNHTLEDYWKDVDFSDTALISSKTLSDKLVNYFYSFTDGDEQRFDSLSIAGLSVVLGKAKVNMKYYEYILEFALNGYTNMGRTQVVDYLLNYPMLLEGEVSMKEGLRALQLMISRSIFMVRKPNTVLSFFGQRIVNIAMIFWFRFARILI